MPNSKAIETDAAQHVEHAIKDETQVSNTNQSNFLSEHTAPHYSPKSFTAEYKLESDSFAIGGSGKRVLKHLGGDQYRMELTAKSIFLTNREISQFELKDCNIKPIHYRYERTGLGKDKRYLLDFSPDLTSVVYEENKDRKTLTLDNEVYLDRLSETLAIQCLLASGKEKMEIPIVDKGKIRSHQFEVTGKELIETKTGKFMALRVERIRPPNSSRKTTLWFAPQLNFQLVRMEQKKESRTFTLTLSNYSM